MGWLRNDDDMLDHEKWRRAIRHGGDGVLLLWTRFSSWCSRRLTDGVVPSDMVEEVGEIGESKARAKQLRALLEARLLAWCAADEDPSSFARGAAEPSPRPRAQLDRLVVVGYLKRNPTRARVLAERDRRAQHERSQRSTKNVTGHAPATPDEAWPPRDVVPSRPVPTPPVSKRETEGAERARAHEAPAVPTEAPEPAQPPPAPAQREAAPEPESSPPPAPTRSSPRASRPPLRVVSPEPEELYAHFPEGWRWSAETEAAAAMMGVGPDELQEHVTWWTPRRWSVPVADLDGALRAALPGIRQRSETQRAKRVQAAHGPPRSGPRSRNADALDYVFALATGAGGDS